MADLKPGSYACVSTPGFVAWLIRRACGNSKVNHSFVVTGDNEIVEAVPSGVRRSSLSEYAGSYAVANTGEAMGDAQRAAVVAKAESLIGTGYDDLDLVDLGLESIGVHWRWLIRLCGASKQLICSQLVAKAGLAAVPPLPWNCGKDDLAEVKPSDLAARPGVEPVAI